MIRIIDYIDSCTPKGMKGEDGLRYFNNNKYVDKILRETLEKYCEIPSMPITGTTIEKQFKQI